MSVENYSFEIKSSNLGKINVESLADHVYREKDRNALSAVVYNTRKQATTEQIIIAFKFDNVSYLT